MPEYPPEVAALLYGNRRIDTNDIRAVIESGEVPPASTFACTYCKSGAVCYFYDGSRLIVPSCVECHKFRYHNRKKWNALHAVYVAISTMSNKHRVAFTRAEIIDAIIGIGKKVSDNDAINAIKLLHHKYDILRVVAGSDGHAKYSIRKSMSALERDDSNMFVHELNSGFLIGELPNGYTQEQLKRKILEVYPK